MCRAIAEGGRRCTGGASCKRANQAIRQRHSRARRALERALEEGDDAATQAARDQLERANTAPVRIYNYRGHAQAQPPVEPTGDPVADADALADAYHHGYEVVRQISGGQNSESVTQVQLADGRQAVVKEIDLSASENPNEAKDAYLTGLTAGALGMTGTTTAMLGKNKVISEMLPGITGDEHLKQTGNHAVETRPKTETNPVAQSQADSRARSEATNRERRRVLNLKNSREIALLDYVTGNLDRNSGNYLVDGDTVHPIDHSFSYFGQTRLEKEANRNGQVRLDSPFAQTHLRRTAPDLPELGGSTRPVPKGDLTSPFSRAEMATFRTRLESLEPAFRVNRAGGKFKSMMSRFAQIEEVTGS